VERNDKLAQQRDTFHDYFGMRRDPDDIGKIIDTVIYGGEKDLLHVRMLELEGLVSAHLIVEGECTFRSKPVKLENRLYP